MSFGFTSTVVGNEEHPQGVICYKVIGIEIMLPNKMKRHLERTHENLVNKPREYFASKLKTMTQQKCIFAKEATILKNLILSQKT